MGTEWKMVPLGDVCSRVTYGFTNPMPTVEGGDGPFLVTAKDIKDGRINYITARRTTWDAFNKKLTDKSRPNIGDVLLTKDGSIGRLAICDKGGICINQSVALIQGNGRATSEYIKYLLESPEYQRKMEGDSDGTTIKHIYITRVDKMEVPLPSLAEQKAITNILGTLDDKIELNRKTNETLEGIAKALFKSWFVDFDPVRAKVEGRPTGLPDEISELFPDSLEGSELGEIPSGWSVKKIGDVVVRLPVGQKFDKKTVSPNGIVPVLDQSSDGIIGFHDQAPGVLASESDPLFTFANHTCSMRFMMESFSVIQNVFPLKGESVSTDWLYQAALGKQVITEYKGHYPDFIDHEIVVPTKSLDFVFGDIFRSFARTQLANKKQSLTLEQLRDALLPRLISGELRVPDAEKMLEEVGI